MAETSAATEMVVLVGAGMTLTVKVTVEPATAAVLARTASSKTDAAAGSAPLPGAGIVAGPGSVAGAGVELCTIVFAQWFDRSPPAPLTSTQWATLPT